MDQSAVIREFANYLKFEKHFSAHTAKCYSADLDQFVGYLAESGGESAGSDVNPWDTSGGAAVATETQTAVEIDKLLLAADVNTIRSFMASLTSQQYSKSTTARKLATLRSFYKFLVKRS